MGFNPFNRHKKCTGFELPSQGNVLIQTYFDANFGMFGENPSFPSNMQYLPGSSKCPRLDPQVTFSGLMWPPFRESKGHLEEAAIWILIVTCKCKSTFIWSEIADGHEFQVRTIDQRKCSVGAEWCVYCASSIHIVLWHLLPRSQNQSHTSKYWNILNMFVFKWNDLHTIRTFKPTRFLKRH